MVTTQTQRQQDQREVEMMAQAYMTQVTVSSYTPVMAVAWPVAAARVAAPRRAAVAPGCEVTEHGVLEVLEAAGALSVEDIAEALCSTVREVQEVVWRMVDRGGLRADEWGRVSVRS